MFKFGLQCIDTMCHFMLAEDVVEPRCHHCFNLVHLFVLVKLSELSESHMPRLYVNKVLNAEAHQIVKCFKVFFAIKENLSYTRVHKNCLKAISHKLEQVFIFRQLLKIIHIDDKDHSMCTSNLDQVYITADSSKSSFKIDTQRLLMKHGVEADAKRHVVVYN